jgi:peptidoglycan/xylan/chitin deacetylase (PgdA/CDA1 family)
MPASVLLVTSVVGNDALVWVNELTCFLHTHTALTRDAMAEWLPIAPNDTPAEVIHAAKVHFDAVAVDRVLAHVRSAAGVDARGRARSARLYLSWEEIAAMAHCGISFGSHSVSHPNLVNLTASMQREELTRARDAVRARLGNCDVMAYPFGAWNVSALEGAVAAGHRIMLEIGGDNRPFDPRHVGRIAVRATTDAELFAELEVLAPARAQAHRVLRQARHLLAFVRPSPRSNTRGSPEASTPGVVRQ